MGTLNDHFSQRAKQANDELEDILQSLLDEEEVEEKEASEKETVEKEEVKEEKEEVKEEDGKEEKEAKEVKKEEMKKEEPKKESKEEVKKEIKKEIKKEVKKEKKEVEEEKKAEEKVETKSALKEAAEALKLNLDKPEEEVSLDGIKALAKIAAEHVLCNVEIKEADDSFSYKAVKAIADSFDQVLSGIGEEDEKDVDSKIANLLNDDDTKQNRRPSWRITR